MARTSRNDPTLTAESRPSSRLRWLLITAAVLVPIALGALITVVLYVTRPQPVLIRAPVVAAVADLQGRDGSVLVIQPRTTGQVRVPLGTSVEVVLLPGLGEAIDSANAGILVQTTNPPCHLKALCGFPGAEVWTFRTLHAGVGYLRIIFGFRTCDQDGACTVTPYVFKPIVVYAAPRSS
jgi:hypothetical protein